MEIEKLREQVAGERASEPGPQNAIGEVNVGSGPRALSIEALEAMCGAVRDEAFSEGYSRGVAAAMHEADRRARRARQDGETAGVVVGLGAAVAALKRSIEQHRLMDDMEYTIGLMSTVAESLGHEQGRIRENGLHGEREF